LDLPLNLRIALDKALDRVKPSDLSTAARDLSDRYRRSSVGAAHIRTELDVLAYAAFRLPATYAAVTAVLHEVCGLMADWRPHSLLDVGAGPGTASWAGTEIWPSILDVELVEADERMIDFGRNLMEDDGVLSAARWNGSDVLQKIPPGPRDLILLSYVLGELEASKRHELLHRLWTETSGVLTLIEPGTPAGFEVIRASRAHLIKLGAHVVAPCPHSSSCPMSDGDWCHFSQRLTRSRAHRDAKGVTIGYEDEKYSYVAVSRTPVAPARARVLRHPQIRPGHIRLELCTEEGVEYRIVSKRDRARFREARDVTWGGALLAGEHRGSPPPGVEEESVERP
jgi:ribosomal protein RSM22 (predicted rRNA methylase)